VRTRNIKGFGAFSLPNTRGVLAQVAPLAPTSAPSRGSQTTQTQLEVTWNYLSGLNTGGAAIDSYELNIDDGAGGNFVEVVGLTSPYTLNSYIINTGLQSGLPYRCRYRAHNIFGWSDYSPIGSNIVMYGTPEAPTNTLVVLDG
jgi:hypothetical protein